MSVGLNSFFKKTQLNQFWSFVVCMSFKILSQKQLKSKFIDKIALARATSPITTHFSVAWYVVRRLSQSSPHVTGTLVRSKDTLRQMGKFENLTPSQKMPTGYLWSSEKEQHWSTISHFSELLQLFSSLNVRSMWTSADASAVPSEFVALQKYLPSSLVSTDSMI